jgi:hypothetical protein
MRCEKCEDINDPAKLREEILRLKLEAGTWQMRADVRGNRVVELEAERDVLKATIIELLEILQQWEPDHASGEDRQRSCARCTRPGF